MHISAVDYGGAGFAALTLHRAMRDRGVDSHMLVWKSNSGDEGITAVARPGLGAVRRFAGRVWFRFTSQRRYYFRDQRARTVSRRRLAALAQSIRPELLIVHYISDFISFSDLLFLQQRTKARVVFHPLDMGLLTGGCHFAWGCAGYRSACDPCRALAGPMYRNAAASTLADKIEVTRQLDHAVVLATDQLAQDVVGARPFTDSPTRRVLIGVDPKQWGRWSRETARDELGLDRGGVYLFFGSHNLDDPRKGMDLLLSALRSLSADGTLRGSDVRLLVAGNCSDRAELDALGCPVHLLGYVNTNTLAQAYSAADFFVCPSIEDSGPMMVNEAMMSGTPVVGFPIGVLPDLVIDNETGVLAARKDAESLAMALANVLAWDESRRTSAREFCRRTALERCSLDAQIAGFTALADRST